MKGYRRRVRPGAGLVNTALESFGRLDLLVNNAGMGPRQRPDLLELGEASYDEVMSTNLKGPFFLTQRVARHMVDQLEAVLPSSAKNCQHRLAQRYATSTNRGEYCISKAGMGMLTRSSPTGWPGMASWSMRFAPASSPPT